MWSVSQGIARAGRLALGVLALVLAGASPSAPAAGPIEPFEAVYTVEQGGTRLGTMRRTLRVEGGGRYIYESVSTASGLLALILRDRILERSLWTLEEGRPRPLSYLYEESDSPEEGRRVSVEFDWAAGQATNESEGQRWRMDVDAGTQDKLLYQLTLTFDLRRGADTFDYPVADGGRLKNYRFTRLGEETLDSPLGRYRTVKLQHVRGNRGRRTTLWISPELDFMPLRVDQEKDGVVRTAWLTELTPAPR